MSEPTPEVLWNDADCKLIEVVFPKDWSAPEWRIIVEGAKTKYVDSLEQAACRGDWEALSDTRPMDLGEAATDGTRLRLFLRIGMEVKKSPASARRQARPNSLSLEDWNTPAPLALDA